MAPAGIESMRTIRRRHSVVRQAHPVKAEAGATPGPAPGEPPQDCVHPMVTGAPLEAIGRAHAALACYFATRKEPLRPESRAREDRRRSRSSYPAHGLVTR